MVAIKKNSKKKITDSNLSNNENTHIYIIRKSNARSIVVSWKNKKSIEWSKYQIKESDMRVKTATFTTNQYLDLTTGQYCVLIASKMHRPFGGIIMSVEYDSSTGLYSYQCQDFSRAYQSKFDMINTKADIHRVLKYLITRGQIQLTGSISDAKKKKYKKALSGLRPAYQYWEKAWGGVTDANPMTIKQKMIIRNKSFIEVIRDIVFGLGLYIDVYFDKYGIVHIEPFVKDEWLNTGLYITTPEIASYTMKFDTTNVITGAVVNNTDKLKTGKKYTSESLINLDLSLFFGDLTASVDNPNPDTTSQVKTKSNGGAGKKNNGKTKKNTNIYNTKKKRVYINTDSINGYSSDMQKMKDIAKVLKKNGWETNIVGVGSEAHHARRSEVKQGIWLCLYGGLCAGTLKEHCTSDWFLNPLKKNKSRVVVGFFPPSGNWRKGGKYYKHLGPAWDWQGSQSYANIDYPAKYMSKHGIPWMYAKNGKEMAAKFLAGGDNYKTSGKSYKYYDSWQRHDVKWIK